MVYFVLCLNMPFVFIFLNTQYLLAAIMCNTIVMDHITVQWLLVTTECVRPTN